MCQFNKDCYRPQRSCGKVIFSEACIKNSVHGRGMQGIRGSRGVCMAEGHAWQGGMCGRGACVADTTIYSQ